MAPTPENVVAHKTANPHYPTIAPFHPSQLYPESPFPVVSKEPNLVYQAVRSCFHLLALDEAHFGSPAWNPLGEMIRPGETVLLKPNFVKENHPRDPQGWQYVLTHGSVIRAVADYVWKALQGKGKVIVADAPQSDSSFRAIVQLLGLNELSHFYREQGLDFEVIDLRQEEWVNQDEVIVSRHTLPGDPKGYLAFDLGQHSEFATHAGAGRYYGADYDAAEVNKHHSHGRHEYLIAGTAIHCDVFFNLPKLKTHKKAGITVNLKNLVGVNGNKNWLPHHTEGNPTDGGDEFPESSVKHQTERAIVPFFRQMALRLPGIGPWLFRQARRLGKQVYGDTEDVVRSGNWWGNDTTWRMCLDLNKIVLFGNPDGTFRENRAEKRKRYLSLVDGFISGEGRGPMNPDPFPAGLILFGLHPASVDAACAYLMGFDPAKIPIVRQAFQTCHYPLAEWEWGDVTLASNEPAWNGTLPNITQTYHFQPHFGWKGHIERN